MRGLPTTSGAFSPTRIVTGLLGLCCVALVLVALTGCAAQTSQADASDHTKVWETTFPAISTPSLAAALRIIDSSAHSGPPSFPVATASAAIFALGSARLDTRNPIWARLVTEVCGAKHRRLLHAALEHGWTVTVTGFVDTSGPDGPGTLNDRLQSTRARRAAALLQQRCGIPPNRIRTRKGGVGGPGQPGRRITVTFTRNRSTAT
jgi:hypothetical protein